LIPSGMGLGDDRIRRYYLFRAVTSFSLWMPFWTLWAYKNLQSYFLLTVVDVGFWTTMIAFQIPAGLFGDKYGRRIVLFVGEVLVAVGVLAFGLSTELWQLFAANIVWATGICFAVSGDTPFVYDTLLELRRAKEFIGIMARGWAVSSVASAAACVVGGVMVQWIWPDRLDLTLILSAVIALFGSLTIVTLKEPKVDREYFTSYSKQLKEGLHRIFTTRAILVLILFQIVIEIATYVMAVFRSVYMNEDLNLSFFEIGALIAAFTLFGGIVATQAGKIEHGLGEKSSLLFLLVTIVVSFAVVFLVASPIAILVQFPIYAVMYLQSPIIGGYINRRVDSSHRSTVVALASLIFTVLLTAVELPSGWLANEFGTRETMALLAAAVAPVGLYLILLWNKEVDAEAKRRVRTLKKF
jgi:MFS family permease